MNLINKSSKYFIIFCYLTIVSSQLYSQSKDNLKAQQYVQKAKNLIESFKYDSIAYYYFQASKIYQQYEEDWIRIANHYRLTGFYLIKSDKPDTALFFLNRALDIANKYFKGNNKDEVFEKSEILLIIGNAYQKMRSDDKALEYYKDAHDLILQFDSTAKLKLAKIWNHMGRAYDYLNMFDKAITYCKKSLDTREKLLGSEHIDLSKSLTNLGNIHIWTGSYQKALKYHQKALKIKMLNLGKIHPNIAINYNKIGLTYKQLGRYDDAIEYFQNALEINKQIFGELHSEVSYSYHCLGLVSLDKGYYDKALEYYLKGLDIDIKLYGKDLPGLSDYYNNIGSIYLLKGNNDVALEYFQKALQMDIQNHGENYLNLGLIYGNIGSVYENTEEKDKELAYYQKALDIFIQGLGEKHPYVAEAYSIIGNIYLQKDNVKTLAYYEKALDIYLQNYGEQNKNVGITYKKIGNVYREIGDYDKALEYYKKGLQISILVLSKLHPDIADIYFNTAELFSYKQDYNKALNYYQKALVANLPNFINNDISQQPDKLDALDNKIFVSTLHSKAKTFCQRYKQLSNNIDDLYKSVSLYELIFDVLNKLQNDYNYENARLSISEAIKNRYADEAIHTAMLLNLSDPRPENLEKVFEFIEKSKSSTLKSSLNDAEIKQFLKIADPLIEKEKQIKADRFFYEKKIQEAKYQKEGYDTLLVQNYEDKLFQSSRKYDTIIKSLEQEYPDYFKLKYQQKVVEIKVIQDELDKKSALINYFVGDTCVYIYAITKNKTIYKIVKIDSTFRDRVYSYYLSIKSDFTKRFIENSNYFYSCLIKPISEFIDDKSHLIIIPDDCLYYIPFGTLNYNPYTFDDCSKLDYLLNSFSITYHYSATLWQNTIMKRKNTIEESFIGFAPIFDPKKGDVFINSDQWKLMNKMDGESEIRSVSNDLKRFNFLPYSEQEVHSIGKLFNKKNKYAQCYFHQKASEKNFVEKAPFYKYIHIASHSFTNDNYPMLSGIAFSQPNDTINNSKDGILYAGETYNLNLQNTDLVVLSSCKSGIGQLHEGEGFMALSRGFINSNARNIVFSLWNVKDKQTKELMVYFYKFILEGKDYANALRKAKLQLIKTNKSSLPKHWGGWVLLGE